VQEIRMILVLVEIRMMLKMAVQRTEIHKIQTTSIMEKILAAVLVPSDKGPSFLFCFAVSSDYMFSQEPNIQRRIRFGSPPVEMAGRMAFAGNSYHFLAGSETVSTTLIAPESI
jgi:hypothetical protein